MAAPAGSSVLEITVPTPMAVQAALRAAFGLSDVITFVVYVRNFIPAATNLMEISPTITLAERAVKVQKSLSILQHENHDKLKEALRIAQDAKGPVYNKCWEKFVEHLYLADNSRQLALQALETRAARAPRINQGVVVRDLRSEAWEAYKFDFEVSPEADTAWVSFEARFKEEISSRVPDFLRLHTALANFVQVQGELVRLMESDRLLTTPLWKIRRHIQYLMVSVNNASDAAKPRVISSLLEEEKPSDNNFLAGGHAKEKIFKIYVRNLYDADVMHQQWYQKGTPQVLDEFPNTPVPFPNLPNSGPSERGRKAEEERRHADWLAYYGKMERYPRLREHFEKIYNKIFLNLVGQYDQMIYGMRHAVGAFRGQ